MNMSWIGVLPDGWETHRLKYNYREIDYRSQTGDEELLTVSHITGVTPRSQKNVTMFKAESNIGLKICEPDDIVVNTMWAWMAAMGVSAYSGIVSPSYGVYRPSNEIYNPKYLNYLLRTNEYKVEYMRRSTGIRPSRLRLYPEKFLEIRFILPPRDEQDQIVCYLDWKVSQINKLINAKQRQNKLLQEQIDVFTNQVINNSLKKMRLKQIVEIIRDLIVRDNTLEYTPIGVLNRGRGVFHKKRLRGEDLGSSEFFLIEPNTLMFSGQFAWEGAVAITTEKEKGCIASHRYYTVQGIYSVCKTEYLWAFFRTTLGITILSKCSHGAAGRNKPLNFNELLNEYIPLPAIDIQEKITNHVKLYLKNRELMTLYETLLAEYRSRLVSDVVMGKLDVRGVVVPNYEAAEDEGIVGDMEGNKGDGEYGDDDEYNDFYDYDDGETIDSGV